MPRGRFGFKVSQGPAPKKPEQAKAQPSNTEQAQAAAQPAAHKTEQALNSGRKLTIESVDGQDCIKIYAADDGPLEIEIQYTETGPKLKMTQASLELTSTKNIDLNCEDFNVQSTGSVSMQAEGDIVQTSQGKNIMISKDDTIVRGKLIHLN